MADGQDPAGQAPAGTPADTGTMTADEKALQELEAYKSKFEKLIKERQADKSKAQERDKELEELRGMRTDFEKFNKERERADQEKLAEQGKFKELLEQHKSEAAKRESALVEHLSAERISMGITQAAVDANAIAPGDIVAALDTAFILDPKTLKPVPKRERLAMFGIEILDEDGNTKTLKDIVSEYVSKRSHLQAAQAPGGGAGTRGSGTGGTLTVADVHKLPTAEQAKFWKEHPKERKELMRQMDKKGVE